MDGLDILPIYIRYLARNEIQHLAGYSANRIFVHICGIRPDLWPDIRDLDGY